MENVRLSAQSVRSTLFIVALYLFLYIPIAVLVLFSFNNASFPIGWQGFTLRWYHELWHDVQLWHALYNSLVVALSVTTLSVAMGIALIFYIMQGNSRIKNMLNIFYANLIVPEVVLAVGLLSFFTFFGVPLGKLTLIVAHTVLGLGYAVPILYTRYNELDYRLVEASLDLGATTAQTFIRVILPLLSPAIFVVALLVFIISFDDFVLSYFCAGTSAQTLPIYILAMLRTGVSPVVNALSTGLLVLSSLLVIVFCSLTLKIRIF